jgi:hypothetical protein
MLAEQCIDLGNFLFLTLDDLLRQRFGCGILAVADFDLAHPDPALMVVPHHREEIAGYQLHGSCLMLNLEVPSKKRGRRLPPPMMPNDGVCRSRCLAPA